MKKKQTIEEKLQRLNEISHLIGGDTPLETAISLYKEGLGLIGACGSQLKKYEKEILTLKKNTDELFVLEPFEEPY